MYSYLIVPHNTLVIRFNYGAYSLYLYAVVYMYL